MKPSKYNYIIPFGDKAVIYNGVSEQFFTVNLNHSEVYSAILNCPDEYDESAHFFY